MTSLELTNQLLALPLDERVTIAQKIWESIDGEQLITSESEEEAIEMARRRDEEISRGDVIESSHEDVMKKARQSIE